MLKVLGDSGPAVLLLPGGAESVDGFFPGLTEGLLTDPDCRVVLHDRPGTGTSETAGTLADASGSLHDTLRELGVGPVVVIGQSLGGAVAPLLARDHPEDVAGLVLLDPTPVNDPGGAARVERTMRVTATLARLPLVGALMRHTLRASVERTIRTHVFSPEAAAAARRTTELDTDQLARAVDGLAMLARGFDETGLP